MRRTRRVRHRGQLVPDGIEPFLAGLLAPEVRPVPVELGGEIVEVAEVAGLFGGEFGEIADGGEDVGGKDGGGAFEADTGGGWVGGGGVCLG